MSSPCVATSSRLTASAEIRSARARRRASAACSRARSRMKQANPDTVPTLLRSAVIAVSVQIFPPSLRSNHPSRALRPTRAARATSALGLPAERSSGE